MDYFASLRPEERSLLGEHLVPLTFAEGDCIVKQGDPGNGCFVIDAGRVRLELAGGHTDSDVVLGFLDPGMVLGEFSLIDNQPRSASAYADCDVRARQLAPAAFQRLCVEHPGLGVSLLGLFGREMSRKLRIADEQLRVHMAPGTVPVWIDQMVADSAAAQRSFASWTEDRVDALLEDVADAVWQHAPELAADTVRESGFGVVDDKITKCRLATQETYRLLAGRPATGLLQVDEQSKVSEIAAPMGVVLGLVPLTNPVPTIAFKTLICLKSRNSLILSCHRGVLGVGDKTGRIIQDVLGWHGADPNLLLWIKERSSRTTTNMFMTHEGISLILATGGPGMVKAAYSSGTPAIGVGCGNAPAWVCADADVDVVARGVVESKSFDNGVICGSENNLVVEASQREAFIEALERHGAAVLTDAEIGPFTERVVDPETGQLRREMVGQAADWLLQGAGIEREGETKLIVGPVAQDMVDSPWGMEMLAPVISLFTVTGEEDAIALCKRLLGLMGAGHTAIIHTQDDDLARRFGLEMPASRILQNSAGTAGCIGISTGLRVSMTLGCGSWGKTSTTDNVGYDNLFNVKRLAQSL